MSTVHPLLQGILHYLIQCVHCCLVGIYPYVIVFVSINCYLLSIRVFLGGLCLLSILYCMGILHYWKSLSLIVGEGICLYVIGFVSINCCLLSVRVIGWFISTVHPLLHGYPSLLDKSVHYCWVGFCQYVIWFVSINCWLLSVRVLLGSLCLLSIRYYMGIFISGYSLSIIVG